MEIGMFHEFQCPPGHSEQRAFDDSFELVDAAERWGLDCLWIAELHIAPTRSVASAPLAIASAIAARTTRMKIGIAVQVLPLCHPLPLTGVSADVERTATGARIVVTARTVGRTGVEMEAITGAALGAVTLYDMIKGLDRAAEIGPVRLLSKRGGKSGEWTR